MRRPAAPEPIAIPIAIPRDVKHVVVFGGSFDPPHVAHVEAPRQVMERMYGAEGLLVYVPAARSPHKAAAWASDEDRVAMLRLALKGRKRCVIWLDEMARGGPSYMVETLARLRRVAPKRVTLRLLMGADQVGAFHRWREPRKIIGLAEPLVMMREPVTTVAGLVESLDKSWTKEEQRAWCSRVAASDVIKASSTEVRGGISGMLDARVEGYARGRGLYGMK